MAILLGTFMPCYISPLDCQGLSRAGTQPNSCLEFKTMGRRPSLVVQRQRLYAPNAGAPGSIPGQGTRSHMLQLKSSHAAMKIKDPTCQFRASEDQYINTKKNGGRGLSPEALRIHGTNRFMNEGQVGEGVS